MRNFLSKVDQELLRLNHRRERDRRVADRIKAVLLRDKGWSYRDIAEALMLDEDTISKQVEEYLKEDKLKPRNGGSSSKLDIQQTAELIIYLEKHTYVRVDDICNHIGSQYGINYSRQGMTHWLHAHGFSFKKPKEVPSMVDPLKQKEFIEYYKKLVQTTAENEPIFFMDSVHPTMATKTAYGWIRKGKDKPILKAASRTRMNITGAINLLKMEIVSGNYQTINAQSTIQFLQKIKDLHPEVSAIHVILDQSSYHKSKAVNDWVSSANNRIKLHFLPPYSPNLNPIERLWKVMNERVRNNRYFQTVREFKKAIMEFFEITWKNISPLMASRINDNFQIINHNSSL